MSFCGTDFIYDGISSETFGVKIINANSSKNSEGGIAVDYVTDKVGATAEQRILGWQHKGVITFSLTIAKENGFDRREISTLINWLTGKGGYKKLQIIQEDMIGLYYNCYFDSPSILDTANKPYAITFKAVCDAPWAYESVRKQIYTITNYNMSIMFNNISDDNDYLIPLSVRIKARGNGDIKIRNKSDNNEELIITQATTGEEFVLNERNGSVKTSKGIRMLDRFNKRFLKLVPKINELEVTNIAELVIEYQFVRKIGG